MSIVLPIQKKKNLYFKEKIMANYNPFVKPKASQNRNGFDCSERNIYSQMLSAITPVYVTDVVPNDYFEIKCASLIKTLPVNTDAFARIRFNYECYFVPYSQLWNGWNSFIAQRELLMSSYQKLSIYAPHFGLNELLSSVCRTYNEGYVDSFDRPVASNTLRLLDQLGYGSYYSRFSFIEELSPDTQQPVKTLYYQPFETEKYVNAFRIAAYNKIWYDYYRNKFYDTERLNVLSWNFDDLGVSPYVTGVSDSFQNMDVINRPVVSNMSPFNLLMPSQYSNTGAFWESPYSLFNMRYRQWKKDLFMSLMPSAQFGLVSSVNLGTFKLISTNPPTDSSQSLRVNVAGSSSVSGVQYVNGQNISSSSDWTSSASIDVYAIRRAQMMQKWRESVLRGGDDLKGQMEARFGIVPKHSTDDACEFVGAFSQDVEINPVYSTAQTEYSSLGEIAGRGSSSGSGTFKYSATEYGVLMIVATAVPETEYNANGIDKCNTFTQPFDFFTPEFENLGLEPVFSYQLDSSPRTLQVKGATLGRVTDAYMNSVIGYSSRYSNYKTAVDKVHGPFQSHFRFGSGSVVGGSLSHWAMPRFDLPYNNQTGLGLKNFYIPPFADSMLFNVNLPTGQALFDRSTEPVWDVDYDHFLVDSYFDVKAVRPMSVLGLPQW